MEAYNAVWYSLGVSATLAIGYCVHAVFRHTFEKPVSSLLRFTPQGMTCIKCYNAKKSVCKKTDCAFVKFDHVCSIIRNAKKSVDFCVPLCSISGRHSPFIMARKRNIPVRIILDGALSREGNNGKEVIKSFNQAGCLIRFGPKTRIMHHKFIIVDSTILILCTQSWTIAGYFCNFENIEITNCRDAVKAFSDEFEYLWKVLE